MMMKSIIAATAVAAAVGDRIGDYDYLLAILDAECKEAGISDGRSTEEERGKCHSCFFAEKRTIGSPESCQAALGSLGHSLNAATTPYAELMARTVDYMNWGEGDHARFLRGVASELESIDYMNSVSVIADYCPTTQFPTATGLLGPHWTAWYASGPSGMGDWRENLEDIAAGKHGACHAGFERKLTELAICRGEGVGLNCDFHISN